MLKNKKIVKFVLAISLSLIMVMNFITPILASEPNVVKIPITASARVGIKNGTPQQTWLHGNGPNGEDRIGFNRSGNGDFITYAMVYYKTDLGELDKTVAKAYLVVMPVLMLVLLILMYMKLIKTGTTQLILIIDLNSI